MANNLPLIGVDAQVLNSQEYFKTLGEVQAATNKASKAITTNAKIVDEAGKKVTKTLQLQSKATTALTNNNKGLNTSSKLVKDLTKNLDGLITNLLSTVGLGTQFASSIGTWVSGLVAAAAPIAAVVAGVVALVAVIGILGQRSAEIEGVRNAFYALNAQFGMMADDTLMRLRAGSNGLINDFQLMQTVNRALAGSTDALGQAYLQNIDKLMAIAQVQARATGQSVEYLFDSLIRGIKRGSPLIIDNTYLIVSEAEAHQVYADKIGLAVEALSEEQKQIALMEATVTAGTRAIEAAGGVQITTAIKIQQMGTALQNTFDRAAMAIKPFYDLIVDGAQTALNILLPIVNTIIDVMGFLIRHLVNGIRAAFEFLGKLLQPLTDFISAVVQALSNPETAAELARGAGRTMAAYADGLLWGLNTFVLPAVLTIATAIADFLVGQSPPPKGPLSEIFEGGAAVMDAWTKGFLGASLQPVQDVALKVSNLMGDVAVMSLRQVEVQLARIDKFLRPFENRVALLEARFKALDEVVQGAFSSIDKQQEKLLEQLNAGDAAAADQIRALDVERDKWQDILDTQGAVVEDAKYQLALAKATTIAQKSALELQKAKLTSQQKLTKETEKTLKTTEPKAEKAVKGKEAPASPAEEPFGGLTIPTPEVPDTSSWVDNLAIAFGEGFSDASTQLGTTQELLAQIGGEFGRISPEGITERFTSFISPVATALETNLLNPFKEIVDQITFLFTGEGDFEGYALTTAIESFVTGIPGSLATVSDTLLNGLLSPFQTTVDDIRLAVFDVNTYTSLAGMFYNFVNGPSSTQGTLSWLLAQGVALFAAFPGNVTSALAPFGDLFYYALVLPVIDGLNWIIDQFNNFANQINIAIQPTKDYISQLTGIPLDALTVPTVTRISIPPPPGSSRGHIGETRGRPQWMGGVTQGPGLVNVNERGPEGFVLGPATQMMTFPNEFLTALLDIRDVLVTAVSAPTPVSSMSGETSNVTQTFNFNNTRNADDSRRTATMLRLFKK